MERSTPPPQPPPRLFTRPTAPEAARVAEVLRNETVGGVLLVLAAMVGLIWINSPIGDSYEDVRNFTVGPSAIHLDLSLATWAADGLLAIFFFVAGLELKREFVSGDLRDPRKAALPVAAAIGGMAVPALLYVLVNVVGDGDTAGWAIPTATDIAFALAVLAVIASRLPEALRTFLLTLAVVDDLIAITIIAIFFTAGLDPGALLLALVPLAIFGVLVRRRIRSPWLLLPLAALTWYFVHESGVHATVAGVALAFTVPVMRSEQAGGPEAGPGLAEHFEHLLRPVSAGFAVPVFALFSAGIAIGGFDELRAALESPIAIGVVVGLVVGKVIGVMSAAALVSRFTHATLDESLEWWDVVGVSFLCGIGFTVSLLISELAYGRGSESAEDAKLGILVATLLAVGLAFVVLRIRLRVHARRRDWD